ncbi:hypothetical protein LshimejAT787_0207690 [Lyophyllum shimeji]|uniref:Cytochrome P450 n=1 Tax=Lyophyllum shimeji TaxID=47721 RepID=A0A9P3PGV0_LYOSH|nr:hypothetical protein LshimejAT787_0207690 [Lyophyllum shimeji]
MFATIAAAFAAFILVLMLRKTKSQHSTNEPPLLPASLPIFGHALSYAFAFERLYKAVKGFSPDNRPVSLDLMGQRIYLVLSRQDTDAVCKEKTRLAYGPFLDWALPRILGISEHGLRALRQDVDGPHTSIYDRSMSIVRGGLKEGSSLNEFTQSFLTHLQKGLEEIDRTLDDQGELRVPLFLWTYRLAGSSSSHAMLGPQLLDYDKELLDRNRQFEDGFFLFALGLPRLLIKNAWTNRARIHEAFGVSHRNRLTCSDQKAAWWVDESERLSADVGQTDDDVGITTFGFWHALESNPNNLAFWMLAHIVTIPGLINHLRRETSAAFETNTSVLIDLDHILDEGRCPLLHSTYHEALRFTSSATVARLVVEDTVISGYTLLKNGVVLCPARPQHFAEDIWGQDADQFVPDRFIRNPATKYRMESAFLHSI